MAALQIERRGIFQARRPISSGDFLCLTGKLPEYFAAHPGSAAILNFSALRLLKFSSNESDDFHWFKRWASALSNLPSQSGWALIIYYEFPPLRQKFTN
jgi:hypothetical protein